GAHGHLLGLPGCAGRRVALGPRRHPGGEDPVQRRGHRRCEGPVRAVRRHGRAAAGGRRVQMSWQALDWGILGPALIAGMLALARNPHGGEHLKDLLVGQILWVGRPQIVALAVVTALLVGWTSIGGLARWGRFGFYGAFAIAVTASVQLVGVYLVFSSLIV